MNKKIVIIGMTLIFLILIFSGCLEDSINQNDYSNKILGLWETEQYDTMYYYNFYKNGTGKAFVLIDGNESFPVFFAYEITKDNLSTNLDLYFSDDILTQKYYNYSFYENDKKMETIDTYNNQKVIFNKIEE